MSEESQINVLPTPDQRRQEKIEEVKSILTEVRENEMEEMRAEFAGIIAEASRANAKTVEENEAKKERVLKGDVVEAKEPFGFGDVRAAIDTRYESLDPEMRKIRSPKGDAEAARWFRACMTKDSATLREMAAVTRVGFEARHGSRALVAISETSHAASIMPVPLNDAVVQQINSAAVMRGLVQTYSSPNQQYRIPVFGKAASVMLAESGTNTGATGPTPANVILTKHKNQWAGTATEEAVADADFNLVSALVTAAGNAIAYTEDVQICTSQGTSPDFSGSIINGVTDVSEQTATDLSFNDFNTLFFSVPKAYRRGSVILVDSVAARLLTGLLDGGSNRVMSSPSGPAVPITDVPNVIGSVYGMPVYEVPLASGTIWIGNPKMYGLLIDPVLSIKETDVHSWLVDSWNFKVTLREDGNILVADAARYMTGLDSLT